MITNIIFKYTITILIYAKIEKSTYFKILYNII